MPTPAPPPTAAPQSIVLVVAADPAVRRSVGVMLARLGREPLPAPSGSEAVRLLDALRAEVRAAVLDAGLPGTDGPATLAALRHLRPDLPCVFLTGGVHAAEDLPADRAAVLGPPVTPAALRAALAAAAGES